MADFSIVASILSLFAGGGEDERSALSPRLPAG